MLYHAYPMLVRVTLSTIAANRQKLLRARWAAEPPKTCQAQRPVSRRTVAVLDDTMGVPHAGPLLLGDVYHSVMVQLVEPQGPMVPQGAVDVAIHLALGLGSFLQHLHRSWHGLCLSSLPYMQQRLKVSCRIPAAQPSGDASPWLGAWPMLRMLACLIHTVC